MAVHAGDTVTLFEGSTFCTAAASGDIEPGGTQGLFVLEARLLSGLAVLVNGSVPEPLATDVEGPIRATHVGRVGTNLVVERHRDIGDGLCDEVVVRNIGGEAAYVHLEVLAEADFAAPRSVRTGRVKAPEVSSGVDGQDLLITQRRGRMGVRVRVDAGGRAPAVVEAGRLAFESIVPPGGAWQLAIGVEAVVDGASVEPRHRRGDPEQGPAERLARWRRGLPQVHTDHAGLAAVVARCADDLGALRVFDPDVPERAVVAAGVPWAMALHARDAMITAWSALLVDPDLAIGVLETLARLQGDHDDPNTEEQPGRIPRRVPFGGGTPVYGAVDTTPLFVMLLGEVRRWGLANETVERLLPHVDAALEWLAGRADRGGGWVEYQRPHDRGRKHQTWRDGEGAIRAADGRVGEPPLALAEVQALHYAALVARSHFAREAGDPSAEASWRGRADELRARFRDEFWLDDVGYPALALDADRRPLDALGSHLGWCLWTGILDGDQAASVAKHLTSPDLFTGWGVRTLAASTVGASPLGYHHGAVWPHDTAIAAAGLARYGFVDEALRLLGGLLDAAVAFDGRLPELFAGFDRADLGFPVPFPNACVPSAWASASVLLGLRTALRFDPWVPAGRLHVAPVLPEGIGHLRVDDIPLLGARVSIEVDPGGAVTVDGVPPGIEVVNRPRVPFGGAADRNL